MSNIIKKYWKNWLILILIVLNISTIGSILITRQCSSAARDTIVIDEEATPINGQCFVKNMDFSKQQRSDFRIINHQFRQRVCHIITQLNAQKKEMFYELGQSYSDTLKLHRIARNIGDLHQALKDETGRFYLSVKTLCNTDQQKKLQRYFTPLFQTSCCQGPDKCGQKNCLHQPKHNICEP